MENGSHDEGLREKWFRMPVTEQMADIGKEVAEAIRWKHGRCAVEEFNNAVEELRDYFLGDNIYGTTDEMLMHYYGPFMSRRNKHWRT